MAVDTWFHANLPGAAAAIIWVYPDLRFGAEQIALANGSNGSTLETVVTYTAGLDHVDVEACRSAGVSVGHTPFVSDDAVANGVMTLLLALMRRCEHVSSTFAHLRLACTRASC